MTKFYSKGIEDWCWSGIEPKILLEFQNEIVVVVVHPDCKLYLGVAANGVVHGKAKVVDGKPVWVKCSDHVPNFKARFYDSFL